jgi:hypothetical protein
MKERRMFSMQDETINGSVTGKNWWLRGVTLLAILMVGYVLVSPLAVKINGGQVPAFWDPIVFLLESPVGGPLVLYFKLWGLPVEYL